jgi:hypothetical protein
LGCFREQDESQNRSSSAGGTSHVWLCIGCARSKKPNGERRSPLLVLGSREQGVDAGQVWSDVRTGYGSQRERCPAWHILRQVDKNS